LGSILGAALVGLLLIAGNTAIRDHSPDSFSRLYAQKVIFCNHLNIFLSSAAAKEHLSSLMNDEAAQFLRLAERDLNSNAQDWPTLGFWGDACVFDRELDQLVARNPGGEASAPNTYFGLFVSSVADRPFDYVAKVARQFRYGVGMGWPPHGSGEFVTGTDGAYHAVASLLNPGTKYGTGWPDSKPAVRGGLLGPYGGATNYVYRAVSLIFAVAMVALPAMWAMRARFDARQLKQLSILVAIWLASISTAAFTHTLDVWRYIATATPLVALIVAIFGAAVLGAASQESNPSKARAPRAEEPAKTV
jgi:hypothetical protein